MQDRTPAKPQWDSALAAGLGAGAMAVFLIVTVSEMNWPLAWNLVGVWPSFVPPFRDLVYLFQMADCTRQGIDVYKSACQDNFLFNYPPLWLHLPALSDDGVFFLGMALALSAVAVFLRLIRGRPASCGLLALAALLSPAVLLGLERGNADIIVFVLTGVAALTFSGKTFGRAVSFLLLGAGILLKFYPVFAVALLARFSRRAAIFSAGLAAFACLYAASISPYMALIYANMQRYYLLTYGYKVPFLVIDQFRRDAGMPSAIATGSVLPLFVLALVVLSVMAFAAKAWRGGRLLPLVGEGEAGKAFLLGAGIYCGTFLLEFNYAYRLIFLLLCLPQIFDWRARAATETWATRLLACLILVLWLGNYPMFLAVTVLSQWALFAALGVLLFYNALATAFPHGILGIPAPAQSNRM